jgi:hypothetical protein
MSQPTRWLILLAALTLFLLPLTGAAEPEAPGATLMVTNTSDSGAGSFRQAIIQSNATAGKDTIQFNIPGAGPHVIPLTAALQAITDPVNIDGTSQPGASCASWPPTLQIVLLGTSAGVSTSGLVITGGGTIVKGLNIQRFGDHGVVLQGNGGNQIDCSFIGTNSTGEATNFGNDIGVMINGSANNIISRSVISGNKTYGIYVGGAGATGNQVRGSYIGTNKTGSAALPNDSEGILVQGAPNSLIGGSSSVLRNVISGNAGHGVAVVAASGTKIEGNYIGLNAAGTGKIANSGSGVRLSGASGAVIGGTTDAQRNVISGNSSSGIQIDSSSGAQVLRNYIGVNASADGKLANGGIGVFLLNSSGAAIGSPGNGNVISGNGSEGIFVQGATATGNQIRGNFVGTNAAGANLGNDFFGIHLSDAPGNTVGGTTSGQANVIAFNAADGVYVSGDSATGNAIQRNSIYGNGDLGIDLGENGVTPNDAGDPDSGPNGLQNYPVLTSVNSDGASTTVKGTLNSKANTAYRLEFFYGSGGSCDPSGYGEGRSYLGALDVTTNGSGNASFNGTFGTNLGAGSPVVATATDPGKNTSEFSACRNAVFVVKPKTYLPSVFN